MNSYWFDSYPLAEICRAVGVEERAARQVFEILRVHGLLQDDLIRTGAIALLAVMGRLQRTYFMPHQDIVTVLVKIEPAVRSNFDRLAAIAEDSPIPDFRLGVVEDRYVTWTGITDQMFFDLETMKFLRQLPAPPVVTLSIDINGAFAQAIQWVRNNTKEAEHGSSRENPDAVPTSQD